MRYLNYSNCRISRFSFNNKKWLIIFQTERKRMSVIVKDSSGDIWLYCKGADSALLPLIVEGKIQEATVHISDFSMVRCLIYNNRRTKARIKAETVENLFAFLSKKGYTCTKILILLCHTACRNFVFYNILQKPLESLNFQRGLRTLVVAYKKMQHSEYDSLIQNIEEARQIIGAERETRITRAYNLMENGLTLLGVTAVEDRLQDKVEETLECLRVAGIKVSSLHRLCVDYQSSPLPPTSYTFSYHRSVILLIFENTNLF